MNIRELKSGMEVLIDMKCLMTSGTHTLVPEMKKLRGTIQTVDYVGPSGNSVNIGGWNWHPNDLHSPVFEPTSMHESKMPKDIKPFDPNELVL